jgi:hypothetical protein
MGPSIMRTNRPLRKADSMGCPGNQRVRCEPDFLYQGAPARPPTSMAATGIGGSRCQRPVSGPRRLPIQLVERCVERCCHGQSKTGQSRQRPTKKAGRINTNVSDDMRSPLSASWLACQRQRASRAVTFAMSISRPIGLIGFDTAHPCTSGICEGPIWPCTWAGSKAGGNGSLPTRSEERRFPTLSLHHLADRC